MTKSEARAWLARVEKRARSKSRNAVAQEMGMSPGRFNRMLLETSSTLQEIPPEFSSRRELEKPLPRQEVQEVVRGVGQGGRACRVRIPQRLFQEMGWQIEDQIRIRKSGKRKIVIEKI